MTAATQDLTTQLVAALKQVRAARHHPDCRCHAFRDLYCNGEDMRWSYQIDRLLEAIRRQSF